MWTFDREQGGPAYVVRLDAAERAVVLDAIDDVVELLGGPDDAAYTIRGTGDPLDGLRIEAGPVPAPHDPALRRLLPDASREDAAVSAEFRRLTDGDLRATKVANLLRLRAVVEGARPQALVLASEAGGVAAALTDLRLVISERLGLRTDADADAVMDLASPDHPVDERDRDAVAQRFLATLYVVLSMLQESLVELMLESLPNAPNPGRTGLAPGPGPGAQPGPGPDVG